MATLSTRLIALTGLVLPIGLSAQTVTIQGETLTALGCYAKHPHHAAAAAHLPKGRKFGKSLAVSAVSGTCSAEFKVDISGDRASALMRGWVDGGQHVAGGTSHSFANPTTQSGTPRLAFLFRADKPVSGRIIAKMSPRAYASFGYSNRAGASVSVAHHPPQSTDSLWAAPVTKEFAVTLGSVGTRVEVDIWGRGRSNSFRVLYDMTVELSFQPGPRVTSYGTSCGHAWTAFDAQSIQLTYQMGLHRNPTVLVFGSQRTALRLHPIYRCMLFVAPIAIVPGPNTDRGGLASLKLGLPPKIKLQFLVQAFGIEGRSGRLHSTNGIEIRLGS